MPLFSDRSVGRLTAVLTIAGLFHALAPSPGTAAEPKMYETFSILRVRQDPGVSGMAPTEFLSLPAQMALIKSPIVINAALASTVRTSEGKSVRVASQPWIASRAEAKTEVEWLADQIQVRSVGGPGGNQLGEILMIGMKGDDPAQLEVLVNAVTQAYLERVVGEEKAFLNTKRNLLERLYFQKSEDVARKREIIYKLSQRVGSSNPATARAKKQLLQEYVAQLRKEIIARRIDAIQREEAISQFKRLHGLEQKLKVENNKPADAKGAAAELARLQSELDLLKAVTTKMETELQTVAEQLGDLETSTEELERRKEELALALATANKLGATLEQYDLEARSDMNRVTLLQPAPLPRTPINEAKAAEK
jgi:hypothetical protein